MTEQGMIRKITGKKRMLGKGTPKGVRVGIGDDAAIIRGSVLEALTTDCLVENVHFRLDWAMPEQIGWKAMEQNVSDIYAMGGKPRHCLVSLVLRKGLPSSFAVRLYRGLRKSGKRHGVSIIGGNLSSGSEISVHLTLIGSVGKPCLRKGARPGDFLMVSKPLGRSLAGMLLLEQGIRGFDAVKKGFLEPCAHPEAAGKMKKVVSAMMDISDGLVGDVRKLCDASGVGAVLYLDNLPLAEGVERAAGALGKDPMEIALSSGEEFALLYAVPEKLLSRASGFLIGEITRKRGVRSYRNGKTRELRTRGYDHLQK